jgi:hypothetical protein
MSDALKAFEFPPEQLQVGDSPKFLMLQIHAYLRSGIPVILGLETGGEGHAVTAVGYCTDTHLPESHLIEGRDEDDKPVRTNLTMKNLQCRQIYVHDDRIGPYARATMQPMAGRGRFEDPVDRAHPERNGSDRRYLKLTIDWPNGEPEETWVRVAIAPLYPKLRTSAEELVDHSLKLSQTHLRAL